jgi:hypothetical protein
MANGGHFQYESASKMRANQLFQGDVLERTGKLQGILKELYPYAYQNQERYPFFVVLTQSCDLVPFDRRGRKAEHITLAAARPLRFFLEQEIDRIQTPALKTMGICLTRDKTQLLNKVERLMSNEEYPYFYLHPSAETPFAVPHIAYLRITFPLQTGHHYDTCLEAKRVQLAPEFQAKLGWLTTLVFGRVATRDFDPKERREVASNHIETAVPWRKERVLIALAKQKGMRGDLEALTEMQLAELLKDIERPDRYKTLVDSIITMAQDLLSLDEAAITEFRSRLLKDENLKAICTE